jgi:predicted AlkP superfamily pyrophosphatase or phosphodiesterase
VKINILSLSTLILCLLTLIQGCSLRPGLQSIMPTATKESTATVTATAPQPTATATITNTPTATATPFPKAEYLVLVTIDGCRPDYLSLAPVPNLKRLMDSGVTYSDAWVGSLMSNTPASHTEISTGTFPNHSGIIDFSWRDSDTWEDNNPTILEAANNNALSNIVKRNGVPTLAGLVKQKYPEAKIAAIGAQKYYAQQAMGAGPSDYIVYAVRISDVKPTVTPSVKTVAGKVQDEGTPPDETLMPRTLDGYVLPEDVMSDPRVNVWIPGTGDENLFPVRVASVLVEKYKPRALFVNLPSTDTWGHDTGGVLDPKTMGKVIKTADKALGELIDAYKQAGIYDKTLWIVTADHGMMPVVHTVSPEMLERAALKSGFDESLNGSFYYIKKPAKAMALVSALEKAKIKSINGFYAKVLAGEQYIYKPGPATEEKLPPLLNRAYLYLMSTFVGPASEEVIAVLPEDTMVTNAKPNSYGDHSEIGWAIQHIPLVISGPGVKQGVTSDAPARLVDLAPTIARLMGFPTTGMDGIVLADGLLEPVAEDVIAQINTDESLVPLRDALKLGFPIKK